MKTVSCVALLTRLTPQPPSTFLFGHLKVMGEATAALPPNCHPQHYYTWIAQKYDLHGIWYLDLWPFMYGQAMFTTPELMDQIHVTRAFKQHSMSADFMEPIIGRDVIATVNGPVWKQLHSAMLPAFSWSHIRNLTSVVVEECMQFRKTLDRFCESGETFSMEEASMKLIFDVIARVIFNFPLHAQTQGSAYLDDLQAMVKLQEAQLSMNPIVKLQAAWKKRTILARLHPAIAAQIKERWRLLRKEQIVPSRKDPYSILDLMLRDQLLTGDQSKRVDTDEIAPDYLALLITNIKALLLGGHGTTTDTLCYCYMLLSRNPEVVSRLREEHDRVFGKGFDITVQEAQESPHKLQELEYTTAVIKETLRLFPVGFGLREAHDGATVTFEGREYPADNKVGLIGMAMGLHYDASYYPEPAKFKPERFMDPSDPMPNKCFRTFSRGTRACIGQNLAISELQAILLLTVRDYDFEYVTGVEWQKPNSKPRVPYTELDTIYGDVVFQELGIEAKPRGGMMMKVSKRKQ